MARTQCCGWLAASLVRMQYCDWRLFTPACSAISMRSSTAKACCCKPLAFSKDVGDRDVLACWQGLPSGSHNMQHSRSRKGSADLPHEQQAHCSCPWCCKDGQQLLAVGCMHLSQSGQVLQQQPPETPAGRSSHAGTWLPACGGVPQHDQVQVHPRCRSLHVPPSCQQVLARPGSCKPHASEARLHTQVSPPQHPTSFTVLAPKQHPAPGLQLPAHGVQGTGGQRGRERHRHRDLGQRALPGLCAELGASPASAGPVLLPGGRHGRCPAPGGLIRLLSDLSTAVLGASVEVCGVSACGHHMHAASLQASSADHLKQSGIRACTSGCCSGPALCTWALCVNQGSRLKTGSCAGDGPEESCQCLLHVQWADCGGLWLGHRHLPQNGGPPGGSAAHCVPLQRDSCI